MQCEPAAACGKTNYNRAQPVRPCIVARNSHVLATASISLQQNSAPFSSFLRICISLRCWKVIKSWHHLTYMTAPRLYPWRARSDSRARVQCLLQPCKGTDECDAPKQSSMLQRIAAGTAAAAVAFSLAATPSCVPEMMKCYHNQFNIQSDRKLHLCKICISIFYLL